jgi:2-amino-4-hydroxy-6-hydroxymethyldihydropteridine diphosphokinase
MATAAIAIGSNLGDRLAHISAGVRAVSGIEGCVLRAHSGIIETPALVPPGSAPGPDYLNAVIVIDTRIEPMALLESLLSIERSCGRERSRGTRWGARTLDLDLLLVDARVIDLPGLVLPHPRLEQRRFVLEPLARVLPEWVHPVHGRSVVRMLADLG